MVHIRDIPLPYPTDTDQPHRLRFGEFDRIIIDQTDWTCLETTDDGYILQTVSAPRRKFQMAHIRESYLTEIDQLQRKKSYIREFLKREKADQKASVEPDPITDRPLVATTRQD
jgi:hypothetical protein